MSTAVSLVVGAAQGIGRATALTLARAGHRVVLADRDPPEGLRKTAALIGEPVPVFPVDIRDSDAVDFTIDSIESDHGPPIAKLAHVPGCSPPPRFSTATPPTSGSASTTST